METMMSRNPQRVSNRRSQVQQGQAAVEFLFGLLFLIALVSLLFQALHFELDVFNKSNQTRYDFFHKAHQSQNTKSLEDIDESLEGKKLSELVPYTVLFQPTGEIGNLKFGPRKLRGKRGTKEWTVATLPGIEGIVVPVLAADHYEETAGEIASALGAVGSLDSLLSF